VGNSPLLTLHEERIPGATLFVKRLIDVVLSGVLCSRLDRCFDHSSTVKLDSPGPAFYSALRVGRKGRRFRCHKFPDYGCQSEETKEKLRARNLRRGADLSRSRKIRGSQSWEGGLRRYSLERSCPSCGTSSRVR